MNKVSLLSTVKKINPDQDLYLVSVYDVEPSGIIIHAYNQTNSKEYFLPVSENEVKAITLTLILTLTLTLKEDKNEALDEIIKTLPIKMFTFKRSNFSSFDIDANIKISKMIN
jgi:hypothetical protein